MGGLEAKPQPSILLADAADYASLQSALRDLSNGDELNTSERAIKAELGIEIDRLKVSLEDLTDPSAIRKRPTNRAFRSFLTREKVCPLTGKRMVHSNTANGF